MNQWNVSVECFSLGVVLILAVSFHETRWFLSAQGRRYRRCLWLSAASILLNILCVFTLRLARGIPIWIHYALNSLYFLTTVGLSALLTSYLFHLVLGQVYHPRRFSCVQAALRCMVGGYAALLAINPWTGWMFRLEAGMRYVRGPLINVGYALMAVEMAMLLAAAAFNRARIGRTLRRLLAMLLPTLLLLIGYQLIYPNLLLNGSLIVATDLILLLYFQSRGLESDPLTLVGNRTAFYQEVAQLLRGSKAFQVVLVSIRQFETVNQHYGYQAGDELLCEVAGWMETAHEQGHAFRIGNMNFALLALCGGEADAQTLLTKVRDRFNRSWQIEGQQFTLNTRMVELIRVGQPWRANDVVEYLRYALEIARERGCRLLRFDEEIFTQLSQRKHVLNLMERALAEDRFEVWYQPIFSSAQGRFDSAEALLRLRDDDGQLVPTSMFISLAEESGMVEELTWFVFDRVCRLLGGGRVPQLDSVSVNLSMQQFMSDDLVTHISAALQRYNVPAHRLKLEITERVLLADLDRACQVMSLLSEQGVRFYLDDFGTGYSNVSTVMELPFDCIKLDHSLIRQLPGSERTGIIIGAMVDLFHVIGCDVVAEGVETQAQAQALLRLGADWLQGFYYARAMSYSGLVEAFAGQKGADVRAVE